MEKNFAEVISEFNAMYKLPINENPTLQPVERLENFKKILSEEVNEVDEIIEKYKQFLKSGQLENQQKVELLTDISDWLGDMVVYIRSESTKFGINLEKTLDIIMQSNMSKLGADGKPIYDERGKVMKGPNYWKPESKIAEMLENQLKE
jgi:predicted HAD superfamily Cof-like phosphohydrolase